MFENEILNNYEFVEHVQQALTEKWKDIIPTDSLQVVLDFVHFDPTVYPKGVVLIKQPDFSVLEIPFWFKDSKLSTANSLIYSLNIELEELHRNNWKR